MTCNTNFTEDPNFKVVFRKEQLESKKMIKSKKIQNYKNIQKKKDLYSSF